ncbi:hypothetical protein ACLOJK_012631 [Asimina triloba]
MPLSLAVKILFMTSLSLSQLLQSSRTPSASKLQPIRAANSQMASDKKPGSDDRMLQRRPSRRLSRQPLLGVITEDGRADPDRPDCRGSWIVYRAVLKMEYFSPVVTVFVPPHPLIKHWVSVLRNEQTPCPIFKNAMAELGRLLIYEASRDWLPTVVGEIQSPLGVASVEFIDPREPVAIVPILRAGLALAENAASILPAAKTYHLGKKGMLVKLPESFPEGSRVFVIDPMLATGGTIVAALNLLKERGVDNKQIKVISAVAASPALQKLSEKFPGLHVFTGTIDPTVNDKGNDVFYTDLIVEENGRMQAAHRRTTSSSSSSSQAGGAPTHDLLVFVFKRWIDHLKLALRTCAIRDPCHTTQANLSR